MSNPSAACINFQDSFFEQKLSLRLIIDNYPLLRNRAKVKVERPSIIQILVFEAFTACKLVQPCLKGSYLSNFGQSNYASTHSIDKTLNVDLHWLTANSALISAKFSDCVMLGLICVTSSIPILI